MSKPQRLSRRFPRTLARGANVKRATILLSVGLLLVPMSLAGKEHKQKKWEPTPLVPIQATPLQRIIPMANDPKDSAVYSATMVDITASGSTEKIPLKVVVSVHAEHPAQAIGKDNEIWLLVNYASLVAGQKPDLAMLDYVVDTSGVQVTDGERVVLERVSLASLVNQVLDAAASSIRTFIPSAPPPPPVGSPSTYYIDCFAGYQYYGYGVSTGGASCQARPDNSGAQDVYAAQQTGYLIGTAIQAWRVRHHNQAVQKQAREALVFYQDNYLRDRLTFLGSDLVLPKPKSQNGIVIYRRADGLKPVGPFTVSVPVLDPGAGSDTVRMFTFRFVDAP